MNGVFVIGPMKSGTTLMMSLLDSHPELTSIPLEIKFYEHYFNTLSQSKDYSKLNNFFFNESKIKLMDSSNSTSPDVMTSGRANFDNFNFASFHQDMKKNELKKDNSNANISFFKKYLLDLHKAYSSALELPLTNKFVAKEGMHGLPYINQILSDFPNAKFIVMVRDPRDMFASFKLIRSLIESGRVYPSLIDADLSFFSLLFGFKKKSFIAYMDYFNNFKEDSNFCFVRYEDLVEDTLKKMKELSTFIGINFHDSMIKTSTAGNLWGGNSSNEKPFNGVSSSRTNKWKDELDEREIRIIEYFFSSYLNQHGYQKENNYLSAIQIFFSFRLSDFNKVNVSFKDFFRPYLRIFKYIFKIVKYYLILIKRFLFN